METMSSSIEPVVPRTANLLACKQWWRVCFLYGDQQKYYRQVYGKAAAQRLALSTTTTNNDNDNDNDNDTETAANENDNQTTPTTTTTTNTDAVARNYDSVTDFIEAQLDELQDASNDNSNSRRDNNNENSHVTALQRQQETPPVALFPAKYQNTSATTASMTMRKSKKLLRSLRKHNQNHNDNNKRQHRGDVKHNKRNGRQSKELRETLHQLQALTLVQATGEATKSNARVTVLDDPFLFGIDEDHLGDLIRRKQYPINATDDISKYFNYYVDEQQQSLPETVQEASFDDLEKADAKPALPPKKKQRPVPPATDELQLNQSDLQFLNLNLRSRSWPRPPSTSEKVEAHDISFTFTEVPEDDMPSLPTSHLALEQQDHIGLSEEPFTTDKTSNPDQDEHAADCDE